MRLLLALLAVLAMAGCRTSPDPGMPPGYDADTDPAGDPSTMIGGPR